MTETVTVSISRNLRRQIDEAQGDVSRSRFVTRALSKPSVRRRAWQHQLTYPLPQTVNLVLDHIAMMI